MAPRSQLIVAHLAFDPARRVPPATRHDAVLDGGQFRQDLIMKRLPLLWGEKPPRAAVFGGQLAPHAETTAYRDRPPR